MLLRFAHILILVPSQAHHKCPTHTETLTVWTGDRSEVILSALALSRSLETLHTGLELLATAVAPAFHDVRRRRGWTGVSQENEDLQI